MYQIVRTQGLTEIKALSLLLALSKTAKSARVASVCRDTLAVNSLGPIVFVTPEFGRFSTVGGVGVILDGAQSFIFLHYIYVNLLFTLIELARSLVILGCEVYVVSPYYNFGKDGKTGYLEKEEIKWERNIVTYIEKVI